MSKKGILFSFKHRFLKKNLNGGYFKMTFNDLFFNISVSLLTVFVMWPSSKLILKQEKQNTNLLLSNNMKIKFYYKLSNSYDISSKLSQEVF